MKWTFISIDDQERKMVEKLNNKMQNEDKQWDNRASKLITSSTN